MKVKLLKKLRKAGKDVIHIRSVTEESRFGKTTVTGVSYGYSDDRYSNIWDYGMTKEELINKACRIYIKSQLPLLRKKYRKSKNAN